jgi:hypothetical protein
VKRGKTREGGVKRTAIKVRSSVVERGEDLQQVAPTFEAAATAIRKRKAEDSVSDKLTGMTATIEQLMAAQKEIAES